VWGVMTEASHRYSSSWQSMSVPGGQAECGGRHTALMVRIDRLTMAVCISSTGAIVIGCVWC
jgi:hypothetical protein